MQRQTFDRAHVARVGSWHAVELDPEQLVNVLIRLLRQRLQHIERARQEKVKHNRSSFKKKKAGDEIKLGAKNKKSQQHSAAAT